MISLRQQRTLLLRRPEPVSLAPLPLRRQSRDRLPAGGTACGPASARTVCEAGPPICLPTIAGVTACMLDAAIVRPSSSTAHSSAAAESACVLDAATVALLDSYLPPAAHAAPAAASTCVPRAATAAPSEPRPPGRWRHDMRPCQRQDRLRSWGPDLLTRHRRRDGLHARRCDRPTRSSTARSSAAAESACVLDAATVAPSKPYLPTAAAHTAPAATSTCVPCAATAAPLEPRPPGR